MKALSVIVVSSIFLSSLAVDQFQQHSCSRVNNWDTCLDSVNADYTFDSSKCLLIHPPPNDQFLRPTTCASWKDVQEQNYDINYNYGQFLLTDEEKQDILTLEYHAIWSDILEHEDITQSVLQDVTVFENSTFQTLAVLGYDPATNSIIELYRGTETTLNWVEDVVFLKLNYSMQECDCRVHAGFYLSYKSLKEQLEETLPAYLERYPDAKLVVTGHSLGGALAVLAAMDLQDQGKTPDLFTYGQPRVGDVNFADFQNSFLTGKNLRAVYRNDPVPTMPFEEVMRFFHAGTEVHFYECREDAYVAYPKGKDDSPRPELGTWDDHHGYFCLQDGLKNSEPQ